MGDGANLGNLFWITAKIQKTWNDIGMKSYQEEFKVDLKVISSPTATTQQKQCTIQRMHNYYPFLAPYHPHH